MKSSLSKAWAFLVRSSVDPRRTSLTLKGFGAMAITFYSAQLLPTLTILCGYDVLCQLADPAVLIFLNEALEIITSFIYYALMSVSALVGLVGLARKFVRTVEGNNRTLSDHT